MYNALPTKEEQNAIYFYKSSSYRLIHEATDNLLQNDVEPKSNKDKERIDILNNYLHKHKTDTDMEVYRGETADKFSNITLPSGKNLGEQLKTLNNQLNKIYLESDNVPEELMVQINEIINFVNNNIIDVVNTRFCSTSVNRDIANDWHNVTLEINLPAGSSAVYLDGFNYFSGNNFGEAEVLTSYGAVEHITGAYFDQKAGRIVFKTTLITDT